MGVPFWCFRFDDGYGAVTIDHVTGTLFLEEEPDIDRYRLVFQHLCGVASSPQDSLALIRTLEMEHREWLRRT